MATVIRVLGEEPRLRMSELAALVGLGKEWLRHVFKTEVGVSIHRYAMEVRLQLASKLLATTDRSLKEICDEVGIQDPSNFIRYFKKRFHQTPSEYRKAQNNRFYQQKAGFTNSKQLHTTSLVVSTARATTD